MSAEPFSMDECITELANTIALHAESIAAGTHQASREAVAAILLNNAETLAAWTKLPVSG